MEYSAYIFDLDGTLLDTLDDLTQSVNYALRQFSMAERQKDEVRMMVGNGVRLLIERAVPIGTKDGVTIQVFETFRKHYLEHSLDNTRPYPGIIELFAKLKSEGKKIAIVSNKLQPAVSALVDRFFSQYVDVAIGERVGMRRKPAPDMVLEAIRQLDTSSAQNTHQPKNNNHQPVTTNAVYIGDSDTDILTAQNSGLPCISVLWGFRDREFLLKHGATTVVEKPEEIFF